MTSRVIIKWPSLFASFLLANHKICGAEYGEYGSKLSQNLRFAWFVQSFKHANFLAAILYLSVYLTNLACRTTCTYYVHTAEHRERSSCLLSTMFLKYKFTWLCVFYCIAGCDSRLLFNGPNRSISVHVVKGYKVYKVFLFLSTYGTFWWMCLL